VIDCAFVVWGLIGCAFLLAMDFPFVTREKKKKKKGTIEIPIFNPLGILIFKGSSFESGPNCKHV